jgi:membrane-bound metal-dependent hydrolase YbcI (DUF457 family)
MPDLLTHVLVGYTIAIALSWRYPRIRYPFVAVAMAGAILPDLNRIELLVPAATVETTFAIPFSWVPLHRAGGTLVIVCLGGLLASKRYRRPVFALLLVGAGSHYLLDFFLYKPSGMTGPLLWPFITDGFAIDGFYRSSDRWPAFIAATGALGVRFVDRRMGGSRAGSDS